LFRSLGWPRRADGRRWRPTFGQAAAALSLGALLSLSYLAGAAVMYFGLPSSAYLRKAFMGAQDCFAGDAPPGWAPDSLPARSAVTVDRSGSTWDGLTLCTSNEAAEATLVDMRGGVVHRWKMRDRQGWARKAHVEEPSPDEPVIWERCHLFPNGDLLALCAGRTPAPYGYALAKFDRSSALLWAYSANVHHDFDVGEDGRVYVLAHQRKVKVPTGLDTTQQTYTAESLVVLSPEGEELDRISLLEAFRDSPYGLLFSSALRAAPASPGLPPGLAGPPGGPPFGPGQFPPPPQPPDQLNAGDLLHANSVKVLSRALAPRFPLFKPGMVLLSLRTTSLLAVLDPQSRRVVWAARGAWRCQHDASFLDNGRLLLFDNLGSGKGARVLEYDPVTQAVPWWYDGEDRRRLLAHFRGCSQRLPNGNTLIVEPSRRLLEVTAAGEAVWEWGLPGLVEAPPPAALNERSFTGARRYAAEELTFLKGGPSSSRPR
jgi:hypothetical protein